MTVKQAGIAPSDRGGVQPNSVGMQKAGTGARELVRRLGRDDSVSRTALMDAVEAIMRRDGYAQLSARKIALEAGLNYQLVFYYFQTIEELFLETYRRRTAQLLESYKGALASARPFHALWVLATNRTDGVLSIEYMAMSNHYASIRSESVRHVRQIIAEMQVALPDHVSIGGENGFEINCATLAFLVSSVGNYSIFQQSQGISEPGLEIGQLVGMLLDRLEPDT